LLCCLFATLPKSPKIKKKLSQLYQGDKKKKEKEKMLQRSLTPECSWPIHKSAIIPLHQRRKPVISSHLLNRVHLAEGILIIVHVVFHCQTSEPIWVMRASLSNSLLNFGILQGFLHVLVFVFPFPPPILEPDSHLFFRKSERLRDFESSQPAEVSAVVMEFFL